MDSNESFEEAAAYFQSKTGYTARGKNATREEGPERDIAWSAWCAGIEYMKEARKDETKYEDLNFEEKGRILVLIIRRRREIEELLAGDAEFWLEEDKENLCSEIEFFESLYEKMKVLFRKEK